MTGEPRTGQGHGRLLSVALGLMVVACTGPGGPQAAAAPGAAPAADAGVPSGPPAREPAPIQAGMAAPPGTYDQPVDVLHYDLELALSDTAGWIQGRATLDVRVTGRLEVPLGLDFTGLAVDRVRVDGTAVDALHEAGRLRVPLPDAAPGDEVRIEVLYRGVPDDGLILRENVHGRPSAFADNWPNRARFWFPAVDHPSDKATVSFLVHAPARWQVVANGALQGEPGPTPDGTFGPPTSGPRRSWRWSSDVPHPTYTMVVGAAEMEVTPLGTAACGLAPTSPRPDGCVEVTTWLFPEDVGQTSRSFARADEMTTYFAETFGPFAWEKLANVQSSTRFGGMENSSAIFYSEDALARGANIETTVSHEIVHQWFGDAVTEASWYHLWLSEGFATYLGDHFFEVADGPERFQALMEESRISYLTSEVTGEPVINPERESLFGLLNANSYPKGGWVLHMLRGVVGDEAFFDGVRRYYRDHLNGTALTDDFREAMEAASGQELDWFFEQWLRQPGYPLLAVDAAYDERAGVAEVTVRQEQDRAWPTFRLPMEVEVRTEAGSVREPVVVTERVQTFRISVPGAPVEVVPDPGGWVLKRLVGESFPDTR